MLPPGWPPAPSATSKQARTPGALPSLTPRSPSAPWRAACSACCATVSVTPNALTADHRRRARRGHAAPARHPGHRSGPPRRGRAPQTPAPGDSSGARKSPSTGFKVTANKTTVRRRQATAEGAEAAAGDLPGQRAATDRREPRTPRGMARRFTWAIGLPGRVPEATAHLGRIVSPGAPRSGERGEAAAATGQMDSRGHCSLPPSGRCPAGRLGRNSPRSFGRLLAGRHRQGRQGTVGHRGGLSAARRGRRSWSSGCLQHQGLLQN